MTWPVVGGTGHRPKHLSGSQREWLRAGLPSWVARLRDVYGTRVVISGMAAGWDLWLAEAALEAGLEVWAYIPWPGQTERWRDPEDLAAWARVQRAAVRERMVSPRFEPGTYELRNQAIVDDSTAVFAAWLPGRSSGTLDCLVRAVDAGRPVVLADPVAGRLSVPRAESWERVLPGRSGPAVGVRPQFPPR
jgi:hypothetical protein